MTTRLNHVEKILEVCRNIQSIRSRASVWNHMMGEIQELADEINKFDANVKPGEDGIMGEACDVMLCLVDLIYQYYPEATQQDIYDRIVHKLDKWQRVYGRMDPVDAEVIS